jgi:hypothetical protein
VPPTPTPKHSADTNRHTNEDPVDTNGHSNGHPADTNSHANGQPAVSAIKRRRTEASGAYKGTRLEREESKFNDGYSELMEGEFRALELHGGKVEDDIVCELHTWELGEANGQAYEAVSYLRSFKEKRPITILTAGGKRLRKEVMPNLHSALKYLRYPDRSRFLWINALCIDHSKTLERNVQVPLVQKIFSQASKVCLWLGEEDGSTESDTRKAFDFVRKLVDPKVFDESAQDVDTVPQWKALLDLMSHPLFERRWVVQEVSVAGQATMHYGSAVMRWSDFADVVTLFEHAETQNHAISRLFKKAPGLNHHPDVIGDVQALGATRFINLTCNIFKMSKASAGGVPESLLSLEDLVFQLASFQGWDPHDVIYACVSLSQESHGIGFAVEEPSAGVRKAADIFLSTFRRRVHCDTTPAVLRSKQPEQRLSILDTITNAIKSLSRSETADLDSKRTIDTFIRQSARGLASYNVNYDLPVLTTYKEFIAHVLRSSKSLGILCRPWAPAKNILADYMDGAVPSWIATLDRAAFGRSPAFTRSYVRINANPLIGSPGREPYRASLDLPASWCFPKMREGHNRILCVDGFVLTKITETSTEALGGNIPLKWLRSFGWETQNTNNTNAKMVRPEEAASAPTPPRHPTDAIPSGSTQADDNNDDKELPPEALWRTLVADRGPNNTNAPPFYRRACAHAFRRDGLASAISTNALLSSTTLPPITEFLQRVQEVVWNRQLIRTGRGYWGLAPDGAEKGDLVCVLYGCSVPVVIRELGVDVGREEMEAVGRDKGKEKEGEVGGEKKK